MELSSNPVLFAVLLSMMAVSINADDVPRLPKPLAKFPFKEPVTEDSLHWNMPEDHAIRRYLSKSPGKFLGKVTDEDVESLRQSLTEEDWEQFNPPPITDTQCHVEFQEVKRIPGRCTKLGGHIPACQTDEYVEIDYKECS